MDGQINAKFITTGTMSTARIEGLQNQLNGFLVNISLNSDNIKSLVATQEEDTSYLETLITQTKNNLTSEVNKKVNNADFGTKIQQSYSDVRISWNNISKFIQFIESTLRILDSSEKNLLMLNSSGLTLFDSDGNTKKMALNRNGQQFYESGEYVGFIGTNSLKGYTDKKALSFNLDTRGSYMTWACKDSSTDETYTMKIWYARPNTGTLREGLALGTNLVLNSFDIDCGQGVILTQWNNGAGFKVYGNFFITDGGNSQIIEIQTVEGFINAYRTLNMHGYNIINAGDVASDGRLKKSIYTSNINAIERIKEFKHRMFTWKKNNSKEEIGYIAQEMEKIDKNYVRHNYREDANGNVTEDCYEMRVLPILATATKAIQEQQEIIEKQQKQIEMLMQKMGLPQSDLPNNEENPIEEPETKYPGQAILESKEVLKEAPKYETKIKILENGETEIYQEKEVTK